MVEQRTRKQAHITKLLAKTESVTFYLTGLLSPGSTAIRLPAAASEGSVRCTALAESPCMAIKPVLHPEHSSQPPGRAATPINTPNLMAGTHRDA